MQPLNQSFGEVEYPPRILDWMPGCTDSVPAKNSLVILIADHQVTAVSAGMIVFVPLIVFGFSPFYEFYV